MRAPMGSRPAGAVRSALLLLPATDYLALSSDYVLSTCLCTVGLAYSIVVRTDRGFALGSRRLLGVLCRVPPLPASLDTSLTKVYLPALNDLVLRDDVPHRDVLGSAVSLLRWLMMEGPLSWLNHRAMLRLLLELRVKDLPADFAEGLVDMFQKVSLHTFFRRGLAWRVVPIVGMLHLPTHPSGALLSRVFVLPDASCHPWVRRVG